MGTLLVAGAINTDLIAFVKRAPHAGETVAGGHYEQHGGGKAGNQAVAAARSGANVAMLGAVGEDDFGDARLDGLIAEGINGDHIARIPDAASGVAIIVVESAGENRICDLPGARDHITTEMCEAAYDAIKPTALLAANELPLECLHRLFLRAQADKIPVWFNIAPFSTDARALLPLVNTLLVNRGEAEDVLGKRGSDLSIEELAHGLQDLGVNNVVMTLGSDGVIGFEADQAVQIPAEPVAAVDTTGAGDTFCGAFVAETLRGANFAEALAYANNAAAISVTRRGAQSSIPTRDEIGS